MAAINPDTMPQSKPERTGRPSFLMKKEDKKEREREKEVRGRERGRKGREREQRVDKSGRKRKIEGKLTQKLYAPLKQMFFQLYIFLSCAHSAIV